MNSWPQYEHCTMPSLLSSEGATDAGLWVINGVGSDKLADGAKVEYARGSGEAKRMAGSKLASKVVSKVGML